jgi:hypothetical protein
MGKIFNCKRCRHEWYSKQKVPTICPRCHSAYWHREKQTPAKTSLPRITAHVVHQKKENLPETNQLPRTTPEKPTDGNNEEIQKICFSCATKRRFDCNVKNEEAETGLLTSAEKEECFECVSMLFWTDRKTFINVMFEEEPKAAPVIIEKSDYERAAGRAKICAEIRIEGAVKYCQYKDRAVSIYPYCNVCWELAEIWGAKAFRKKVSDENTGA